MHWRKVFHIKEADSFVEKCLSSFNVKCRNSGFTSNRSDNCPIYLIYPAFVYTIRCTILNFFWVLIYFFSLYAN